MLPVEFRNRQVCVIGLGYVGLTLAVALADCGFRIVGVERDPRILACLAEGRAHFSETGLDKRLSMLLERGRITCHDTIPADAATSVYVVTVGTPVAADKTTKLDSIQAVAEAVSAVLKADDLVILRSTVRVGVTRNIVMPVLDAARVPYDIAFCPERTVEGRAIDELRSLPQVVGGGTAAAALRAGQLFHMLTPSVVRVSSLEAAEMIKLVNNTYRDINFAFSNEIALAAEAAGLSALEVIRAGNLGYPRGGVPLPGPVGGPCLEKDPYIFAEGLGLCGFTPELSLAGRRINESVPQRAVGSISRILGGAERDLERVAVAGLAFKGQPETSDLRGTLAVPLIAALRAACPNAEIVGWDPVAAPSDIEAELGIPAASSLADAARGAGLLVVHNNHPALRGLDFAVISGVMRSGGLIYDLWAMHDGADLTLDNAVRYACFGSARIAN